MRLGHIDFDCRSQGKRERGRAKRPVSAARLPPGTVSLIRCEHACWPSHRRCGDARSATHLPRRGVYVSEDSRQGCLVHRSAYRVVAPFAAVLPIRLMAATSWYVGRPSDDHRSLRVAPHRPYQQPTALSDSGNQGGNTLRMHRFGTEPLSS